MNNERQIQRFADGEVYFWLEQHCSIHLKAASAHGDPVELSSDEAREIGIGLNFCGAKAGRERLVKSVVWIWHDTLA